MPHLLLLALWIQELGMYEFQVVHHPGKRHGNTDGLCQIPCKQCGKKEGGLFEG